MRAEIQCNQTREGKCLPCDLKYPLTARAILPVLDVAADDVKALLVSANCNPGALGPQLKAEFKRGNLASRVLAISRISNKFVVATDDVDQKERLGESTVTAFVERMKAGTVVLENAIPVYDNASLWDVPEIERTARASKRDRAAYLHVDGKTPVAPTKEVKG